MEKRGRNFQKPTRYSPALKEILMINDDKWIDLAASVYGVIDYALNARDDLTIIFITHSQTIRDDNGNMWTSIKTSGQKLNKIGLETKFPTVLLAKCKDGQYIFETQSNNSTAKSPMGMLPEKEMENDIAKVLDFMEKYEKGEETDGTMGKG